MTRENPYPVQFVKYLISIGVIKDIQPTVINAHYERWVSERIVSNYKDGTSVYSKSKEERDHDAAHNKPSIKEKHELEGDDDTNFDVEKKKAIDKKAEKKRSVNKLQELSEEVKSWEIERDEAVGNARLINEIYSLDLGQQSLVKVKVISIENDEVELLYLSSSEGRIETMSLEEFKTLI